MGEPEEAREPVGEGGGGCGVFGGVHADGDGEVVFGAEAGADGDVFEAFEERAHEAVCRLRGGADVEEPVVVGGGERAEAGEPGGRFVLGVSSGGEGALRDFARADEEDVGLGEGIDPIVRTFGKGGGELASEEDEVDVVRGCDADGLADSGESAEFLREGEGAAGWKTGAEIRRGVAFFVKDGNRLGMFG